MIERVGALDADWTRGLAMSVTGGLSCGKEVQGFVAVFGTTIVFLKGIVNPGEGRSLM
jgi:hypothetical protein